MRAVSVFDLPERDQHELRLTYAPLRRCEHYRRSELLQEFMRSKRESDRAKPSTWSLGSPVSRVGPTGDTGHSCSLVNAKLETLGHALDFLEGTGVRCSDRLK
jgi:hypothetical protein